jgi:hypothetical protein
VSANLLRSNWLEEYVRTIYGSITQAISLDPGKVKWLIVPKVKLSPVVSQQVIAPKALPIKPVVLGGVL